MTVLDRILTYELAEKQEQLESYRDDHVRYLEMVDGVDAKIALLVEEIKALEEAHCE